MLDLLAGWIHISTQHRSTKMCKANTNRLKGRNLEE